MELWLFRHRLSKEIHRESVSFVKKIAWKGFCAKLGTWYARSISRFLSKNPVTAQAFLHTCCEMERYTVLFTRSPWQTLHSAHQGTRKPSLAAVIPTATHRYNKTQLQILKMHTWRSAHDFPREVQVRQESTARKSWPWRSGRQWLTPASVFGATSDQLCSQDVMMRPSKFNTERAQLTAAAPAAIGSRPLPQPGRAGTESCRRHLWGRRNR